MPGSALDGRLLGLAGVDGRHAAGFGGGHGLGLLLGRLLARRLAQQLTALERTARQIVILDDRSLLDTYAANRRKFEQAAAEFANLPLDAEQKKSLEDIVRGEAAAFSALSGADPKSREAEVAVESFVGLSEQAQALVARSNALIESWLRARKWKQRCATRI